MKRTKFKSGVYIILNKTNGKAYIGSSVNVNQRLLAHKKALQKDGHPNPHLQNAWNKYGEGNFEFVPVLYCPRQERLNREQVILDEYIPRNCTYNIYPNAGSPLGSRHSQSTIQKQSKVRREYWETHERLFGSKNPFYKKKHTQKTRSIIGQKNKGNLKGNQHAKGNRFSHTSEEIEKMKNSWTPEKRQAAVERGKKQNPPFAQERILQILREYNRTIKLKELAQIVGKGNSTICGQLKVLMKRNLVYQPTFGYYALKIIPKSNLKMIV